MRFDRRTLQAQRGAVLVVCAGSALMFWPWGIDNFDLVKWTVVALGAAAICVGAVGRIVARGKLSLPVAPIVWAVGAFAAALLLATVTSDAPVVSLFGLHGRYGGLLLYASGAVLLLTVIRRFDERSIRSVATAIVVGAGGMTLYGIVQLLGLDPVPFDRPYGGTVISTMGNPNFAAGYLGSTLPLVIWLAISSRRSLATRLLAGGLVLLTGIALLGTSSSQGIAAAGAGTFVLALAWVRGQDRPWRGPATAGLLVAAGLATAAAAAGLAGVGPLRTLAAQRSFELRGYYWQTALRILADQPLLGVGLDRYGVNYRLYRPIDAILTSDLPNESDAAHNVALQLFAGGGLVLGLAYLAVVACTAVALVAGLRRWKGERLLLLGALGGVWLGYQTQAMVSIDVPALAALHWVVAGAVVVVGAPPTIREVTLLRRAPTKARRKALSREERWGSVTIALLGLLALWAFMVPLRADTAAGRAHRLEVAGDLDGALASLDTANRLAPWEYEYWFQRGRYHVDAERPRDALDAFTVAAERAPGDMAPTVTAARTAQAVGQNELAMQWYQETLRIEPRHPDLKVEVARFLRERGKEQEAQRLLEEALRIDPDNEGASELLAARGG